MLLPCCFSLFMAFLFYFCIAAFFPLYMDQYHPKVNPQFISMILIAPFVGVLLSSSVIGANLQRIGRKNMIKLGLLLSVITIFALALTHFIVNDVVFTIVAILSRFLQGIGDSMVQISCLAIVSYQFPEEREQYMGLVEIVIELGLLFGPMVGSILYSSVDYFWTFVALSMMMGVNLVYVQVLLAPQVDLMIEPLDNSDTEGLVKTTFISGNEVVQNTILKDPASISNHTFFNNRRCMFALASSMLVEYSTVFNIPMFSTVLFSYGVSSEGIGMIFSLPSQISLIFAILIYFSIHRLNLRYVTQVAFVFSAIACYLQGPSLILGIPNHLWIIIVGYGLNGLVIPFVFAPCVPEIVAAVYDKEQIYHSINKPLDEAINDRASGLYATSLALGQIMGPMIGSFLYDMFDYRITCDIIAVSMTVYAVVYFVFNILLNKIKPVPKPQAEVLEMISKPTLD